jgi:hypothetical protein
MSTNQPVPRPQWANLRQTLARQHGDFLLLLTLFVSFRLASVWFLRPGGYTRDYSDLIYYGGRASWQDFGLLPYRDYWSEYPPLFAWFTLWIDRLARQIPLWEDERLWFAALFGFCTVLAETGTLIALYSLARWLHGSAALRSAWLYASFFLPVYYLGGWYDALPVATIWGALALLVAWPSLVGALLIGLLLGLGGALKLVPLALLAVTPLALRRWSQRLLVGGLALGMTALSYGWAYFTGPVMTATSLRSLTDRTGWSTLYAWVNGYTRLGKVLGDLFDPAAPIAQYESIYPEGLVLAGWLALGAALLIILWRRQPAPHPPRTVIAFAGLTYAILLLAYSAWNPQYALYLLPFLALLWPNARGLTYALALTFLVLLEHPVYHNLIGPDYAPGARQLIAIDYRQLFLAIIIARTALLVLLAVDLARTALGWRPRLHWLLAALAGMVAVALMTLLPHFGRAYVAGRLATSAVRPLALYLNTTAIEMPVVAQQLSLGRRLRPFLTEPARLTLFGGRPGRIDPLPAVAAQGPFLYVRSGNDDAALLARVDAEYGCPSRVTVTEWEVWHCQGATPTLKARFDQNITLNAVMLPPRLSAPLRLTLFWQSTGPVAGAYTVFVHVVDANGTMIGQWDQVPGSGAAPTTGWLPQQLVIDDYQIPVQLTEAVWPVRVLVGLYDPVTGNRLAVEETTLPVTEARLEIGRFEGRP